MFILRWDKTKWVECEQAVVWIGCSVTHNYAELHHSPLAVWVQSLVQKKKKSKFMQQKSIYFPYSSCPGCCYLIVIQHDYYDCNINFIWAEITRLWASALTTMPVLILILITATVGKWIFVMYSYNFKCIVRANSVARSCSDHYTKY